MSRTSSATSGMSSHSASPRLMVKSSLATWPSSETYGAGIFFSVANVAIWGVVGFNMVIIYTAVRSLPKELFEAAELDGASELQVALRIKLPLIAPAITMVALFSVIGALQLFNEPTTLKPLANAISSTWVPLMRVYTDAFVNNSIYEGAATSFILILMTVAATVIVNVIGRRFARRETR